MVLLYTALCGACKYYDMLISQPFGLQLFRNLTEQLYYYTNSLKGEKEDEKKGERDILHGISCVKSDVCVPCSLMNLFIIFSVSDLQIVRLYQVVL